MRTHPPKQWSSDEYGAIPGTAFALVVTGALAFLAQAARTFATRGIRELDIGMRLAGAGLVFLAIALALAPFALRGGWNDPRALTLYIGAAVLAALTLFIAGIYYRIVPFLVWSRRNAAAPLGPRTCRGNRRRSRRTAAGSPSRGCS